MSGGKFADAVCVWQVQRQPGVRSLPEHPQHRPRLLPQQPRQHAQHQLLGTVQSVSLQEIQQVKSCAPFSEKKDAAGSVYDKKCEGFVMLPSGDAK